MEDNEINRIEEKLKLIEEKLSEQEKRIEFLSQKVNNKTTRQEQTLRISQEIPQKTAQKPFKSPEKNKLRGEMRVGLKIIPTIGIIALILGLSFFLKYAFDIWIKGFLRAIFGIALGFLLVFLGEKLRDKYRIYSRLLTGGGFIAFYLSVWALHSIYYLIGNALAFLLMLAITLWGGFLSYIRDSKGIFICILIGGFIIPFLVFGFWGFAINSAIFTLIYYIILNIGVLGMNFFKKWTGVNLLSFFLTILPYFLIEGNLNSFFLKIFFSTVYFLIYFIIPLLDIYFLKKKNHIFDLILNILNVSFYCIFSYSLLIASGYNHLIGLYFFLLSSIYALASFVLFVYRKEDAYSFFNFLLISASLLLSAIAFQFKQDWTTLFWIILSVEIIWLGFKFKERFQHSFLTRNLGLVFLFFPFVRIWISEVNLYENNIISLFNRQISISLIFIGALLVISYLYSSNKNFIRSKEKKVVPVLSFLANFSFLYLLTKEILNYFAKTPIPLSFYDINQRAYQINMWISLSWLFYSSILILVGFLKRSRIVRIVAIVNLFLVFSKLFFIDLSFLNGLPRVISFIIFGILLLFIGYLYNKYKERLTK